MVIRPQRSVPRYKVCDPISHPVMDVCLSRDLPCQYGQEEIPLVASPEPHGRCYQGVPSLNFGTFAH